MGRLSEAALAGDLFAAPPPVYPHEIPREVCELFEKLALRVQGMGFVRYSADALLHQIRWHEQIERGNRDFKINNNHAAVLARWFLKRHPDMAGFFELRRSQNDEPANP